MRHSRSLKAAAFALLAALSLTACGQKMPERLDGKYPTGAEGVSSAAVSDAPSSQEEPPEDDGAVWTSPKFRSGSYRMKSTTVGEQYYYSGKSLISYAKVTQTYEYDIRLTVRKNGSIKAAYTFRGILVESETQDGTSVIDTSDSSGRDNDTAVYYDLIGQSFTAEITAKYAITLSGIDAIHRKYPYTADVVNDSNMKEVVSDLFYPLSKELKPGSTWSLTQVGMTNTYRVSGEKEGRLYINITGEQPELPEPFTDSDGMIWTYTRRDALSGNLVMDLTDRMIQEQSSYQENAGRIDYSGSTYTFTESAASVCTITKTK